MRIRPRISPSCIPPWAAHPASRDRIHPPGLPSWADWEPAEQTQRVGDVWGDEEGAVTLLPWVLSRPAMRRSCKWGCNYVEACLDPGVALAEPRGLLSVCVWGDRVG